MAANQSVRSAGPQACAALLQTSQPSARTPSRPSACWRATSLSSAAPTCRAPSSRRWPRAYPCWPCQPCCRQQPSRRAAGAPGGAAWMPLSWRSRCCDCTRWAHLEEQQYSLCQMRVHEFGAIYFGAAWGVMTAQARTLASCGPCGWIWCRLPGCGGCHAHTVARDVQ